MSAASKRADRAEERAARILGTARLGGTRKQERVADAEPVRLADGRLLQPEVKSCLRLPKRLTAALDQARRYCPDAIPLAVFSERGQRGALAVLDAEVLAELLGIRDPAAGEQLALALVEPSARKESR
jgi:hypothetical protein